MNKTCQGIIFILVALELAFSVSANADDFSLTYPSQTQIEESHHDSRLLAHFGLGVSQLSSSLGTSLMAFELAGSGTYALSRSWGAGLALREGLSSGSGFSPAYTAWGVYVSWAITGSLMEERRTIAVDRWDVIRAEEPFVGGLKLDLGFDQYLFTGTNSSVIYSGLGAKLQYEFSLGEGPYHYYVGMGLDQVSGGRATITPLQFMGGISLCL